MITQAIIDKTYQETLHHAKKTLGPSPYHLTLSFQVGKRLAKNHRAKIKVVQLGTLLMDVALGKAMKENCLDHHIDMSTRWAETWLKQFPHIIPSEVSAVLVCIKEHHGAQHFTSIEAEICCNADCYRFLSIEGVIGGLNQGLVLPPKEILSLYRAKLKEKWTHLSLSECRQELRPQYKLLGSFYDSALIVES